MTVQQQAAFESFEGAHLNGGNGEGVFDSIIQETYSPRGLQITINLEQGQSQLPGFPNIEIVDNNQEVFDSTKHIFNNDDSTLLKGGLELPGLDSTGFQPETDQSDSGIDRILQGSRRLFESSDTLQDQIREKVVDNLSPEEREQYEQEEELIKEYNRRFITGGLIPPERPETPMHDTVDHRVEETQSDITEQVRADMSPEDRTKLEVQLRQYEEDVDDYYGIDNPLGTGEFFKPKPRPGTAVRDFFKKVKEATSDNVNEI